MRLIEAVRRTMHRRHLVTSLLDAQDEPGQMERGALVRVEIEDP